MPTESDSGGGLVPSEELLERLEAATVDAPVTLGRYEVTRYLGHGGMGTVYRGRDRERGTEVAIKTLNRLEPRALTRLKREFRAVSGLRHPNLVPVHELVHADGIWFFAMDYVEGVDFVSWVRQSPYEQHPSESSSAPTGVDPALAATQQPATDTALPSFAEPEAASAPTRAPRKLPRDEDASPSPPPSFRRLRDALAQLVEGIRAVHEAGLLHLDIKPGNILVDGEGRVALLDFGLVRFRGEDDSPLGRGSSAGAPAYMAPEQFAGDGIGEAADWYALGVVLYRSLTGRRPFHAPTLVDMHYAKCRMRPVAPRELLPEVPADLSDLCMALLAPDPEARPDGPALVAQLCERELPSAAQAARPQNLAFIGRASELDALSRAFAVATSGESRLALIRGASGIGKSALVERFLADASGDFAGWVLRGRCYERETLPYKAFDAVVDQLATQLQGLPDAEVDALVPRWSAELVRAFPALAAVTTLLARATSGGVSDDPIELRRRSQVALRELLNGLASTRPMVLHIDDLQWADGDSVRLLEALLDAPGLPGTLVTLSFRPEEAASNPPVAAWLESLAGRPGLIDLTLSPLAAEEAEALAAATLDDLGADPSGAAASIAADAGGMPYFIDQLARHLAAQGAAVGVTLDELLAARVRALPPDERSLVEVLAVAGNPIEQRDALAAAGLDATFLGALWSLRAGGFLRTSGVGPRDQVELYHDRLRTSVASRLDPATKTEHHLRLARTLLEHHAREHQRPWIFDVVRHFHACRGALDEEERARAAALALRAGHQARESAAFPLALESFREGLALLGGAPSVESAWEADYHTALGLHAGLAEAAWLSAAREAMEASVAEVKTNATSPVDQLPAWEVSIDARIGRSDFAGAVSEALSALALLGVQLPARPDEALVGDAVQRAMAALERVGPEGLEALPDMQSAELRAAMRILTRVTSAAYFASPSLFPLIVCELVVASVEHGLSEATPYGLAVFGIVLNSLELHPLAHTWGQVARRLLDRLEDRSLEARTRHIIHNMVCVWTIPLADTLDDLRDAARIGHERGDLEYAAYAAHAVVHNALYSGQPLRPLLAEAVEAGDFMRAHGEVNALHVHQPFEQVIRCLLGETASPASLNGPGFDEAETLRLCEETGSRSAQCIVRLQMGVVRFHFGRRAEAQALLEAALPFIDGVVSTWHDPVLHQYLGLALAQVGQPERIGPHLERLRKLAASGPENFAHRVALVESERLRVMGDREGAQVALSRAIDLADAGGWLSDLGLAHELAAEASPSEARAHLEAALQAYREWGAAAKVALLEAMMEAG